MSHRCLIVAVLVAIALARGNTVETAGKIFSSGASGVAADGIYI
jgi:predicted small secreted protein